MNLKKHRQGMYGAADEQPDKTDIITMNKIKGQQKKKTERSLQDMY